MFLLLAELQELDILWRNFILKKVLLWEFAVAIFQKFQIHKSQIFKFFKPMFPIIFNFTKLLNHLFLKKKKIDIFINCAGCYAEDVADSISYHQAEEMLQTNILGTVNAFEVARKIMKNQQ